MNRLTQKAPTSLLVGDIEYPICTDNTVCLLTIAAIEDDELTQWEKQDVIFDNIYGCIPHDPQEAIEKALWFLSGGKKADGKNEPRTIDFDIDGDMIYAAFLKSGTDLDAEDIHYWKFCAKLPELPESQFTHVVHLRIQNRRGKLTKDEKRDCDRIGWDVINMVKPGKEIVSDDDIWRMLKGG